MAGYTEGTRTRKHVKLSIGMQAEVRGIPLLNSRLNKRRLGFKARFAQVSAFLKYSYSSAYRSCEVEAEYSVGAHAQCHSSKSIEREKSTSNFNHFCSTLELRGMTRAAADERSRCSAIWSRTILRRYSESVANKRDRRRAKHFCSRLGAV